MQRQTSDTSEAASGIEFAPWPTLVENDELHLVSVRYGHAPQRVDFVSEGFSLELPGGEDNKVGALEAIFLSREKRAAVVFVFDDVSAFRVLDEHGLVDMWNASAETARPANTTFKVKGHQWQEESHLSWFMRGCEFSFVIATGWDCLEVVTGTEPTVELRDAKITEQPIENRQ
jgi:hypothetical protein